MGTFVALLLGVGLLATGGLVAGVPAKVVFGILIALAGLVVLSIAKEV